MDIKEAIKSRHSVRQYKDISIPDALKADLHELIRKCNLESGLHMQLIINDPECFNNLLARYGKFQNVKNYVAIVGPKALPDIEERGGYYGQKVVLAAQMMGLNTCWVAGTFNRKKCNAEISADEKLVCVIAIGYGENEGKAHRSKSMSKVCSVSETDMTVWFKNGVKAALMAPTAINQQKFRIDFQNDEVIIIAGMGPMTKIDLGIVKYNFEAASGHKCR